MCDYMWTRWPDSVEYCSDNKSGIYLGLRRLSIIDLDTSANKPMHSADDSYTTIFNFEIYNIREFRLRQEGHGKI